MLCSIRVFSHNKYTYEIYCNGVGDCIVMALETVHWEAMPKFVFNPSCCIRAGNTAVQQGAAHPLTFTLPTLHTFFYKNQREKNANYDSPERTGLYLRSIVMWGWAGPSSPAGSNTLTHTDWPLSWASHVMSSALFAIFMLIYSGGGRISQCHSLIKKMVSVGHERDAGVGRWPLLLGYSEGDLLTLCTRLTPQEPLSYLSSCITS